MADITFVGTGITIFLAVIFFVRIICGLTRGGAESTAERFQLELFHYHAGGGTSHFVIGKFSSMEEAQDELDDFAPRSPDDGFRIWDTLKRKDVTQKRASYE